MIIPIDQIRNGRDLPLFLVLSGATCLKVVFWIFLLSHALELLFLIFQWMVGMEFDIDKSLSQLLSSIVTTFPATITYGKYVN
jgi:hypothetical protein